MPQLFQHMGVVAAESYIVVLRNHVANVSGFANDTMSSLGIANSVGHVFEHSIRGVSLSRVNAELLQSLLRNPDIESIHEDAVISLSPSPSCPTPPASTQVIPWGPVRIGATGSSFHVGGGVTPSTVDVDVFVIDTGVQLSHPDLRVVSPGRSFVPNLSSADDQNGHGTHVSGIIGAVDNLYGVVGACPGAKINPVRVLDASGSGQFSWVIAGINYVQSLKQASPGRVMVANMSLGASVGTSTYNVLDTAVANCIAAGVPFAVAAGNSSSAAINFSPAHVSTAVCVAAMTESNSFASYSNLGSAVTINAPGDHILSTYLGGTYAYLSGTSMASPMVAGVMADYLLRNPGKTPAQVKAAIVAASSPSVANPLVNGVPASTTRQCLWMGQL